MLRSTDSQPSHLEKQIRSLLQKIVYKAIPCHKNNHNHNKADLFYGDLIISEIVFVFANFFMKKNNKLLTNLNLDSSIKNWITLLTSWDIKSESGLPWDFWSVVHVIKQSRMWSINRLIKWNEQFKTSLRYQSEQSTSGDGLFRLQTKIRFWWNGMKNLIFDQRIQIQIGQKECNLKWGKPARPWNWMLAPKEEHRQKCGW